ncbi:MAG TPA: hypothetical protein VG708_10010 [Mycobacteriales bacterium]|nr:hypothetical protein [Mycobacteriales bacterium]
MPVADFPFQGEGRPDLDAVDRLARLQLTAAQQGGCIQLRDVSGELEALLDFVGLDALRR